MRRPQGRHALATTRLTTKGHITDSKAWDVPAEQRHGIHSSKPLVRQQPCPPPLPLFDPGRHAADAKQPFHTDMGCDVLALQVREGAHRGGRTYLSSAAAVLNCLLRDEPAVARTLLAPDWPVQMCVRVASPPARQHVCGAKLTRLTTLAPAPAGAAGATTSPRPLPSTAAG